jgi:serine protease
MANWTRHRVGLAATGGLAVGALVATGLAVTVDDDQRAAAPEAFARSAVAALPPFVPGREDPSTEPVAPDEPLDVPRAWTAQDPSVQAPPAAVVADAAPEATENTPLRVVTMVNRDGAPEVVIEKTRGPEAAADVVDRMQSSDDVVAVSVDTRVTLDSARTGPIVVLADTLRNNQWALDRLKAEKVWSDYSSGSNSVVAVIDTGVDGAHPDLAGQLTPAGMDYVAGSGDGRTDPHGHGTHVAGIVAAVRGNSVGIAGLAPLAKVMPIRVLDATGSGWSSNIARGIIYAADNGADVINLSLGGPTEDASTKTAVNYAMSKGAVVVAAAGNSRTAGNAVNYPAAYPGVLAVASTERDDTSSAFSNTGPYVDIAAPGGRILSTVPGGYGYMSGTSMATPYVSATAALVTNITGGTLTTEQFERRLTASAWDLGASGWDPEFGYGLTNPHQTLCSFTTCGATLTPTPTASPTPSPAPATTSAPAPAPAPAPTATITPTPSPTTSPTSPPPTTRTPSPSDATTPEKRSVRLGFTTGGGTARRGERVLIAVRATYTDTGRPLPGHQVLIRGWREGNIVLRQRVTTNDNGNAATRIRLRATTRFDLKSPATETTRAATSVTSIRWRIR